MGWIRTVKPDFFRHQTLYKLEQETGLPVRVAFMGMICQCDREGRFRWRPDILKLDVLPWDSVNFEDVLDALCKEGMIRRYEVGGLHYGVIPSFKTHQIINLKEAKSKHPPELHSNSPEFTGIHCVEGKGKEGKGKEGKGREGMQGKGNQEDTNVSLSGAGDGEIAAGQERLLELRRLMGVSQDGALPSSFGKAGA